jgi:hypothetical protein
MQRELKLEIISVEDGDAAIRSITSQNSSFSENCN